jgi:arylsulfatase A-like enzyme
MLCLGLCVQAREERARPNVLMIVVDDLNGYLGVMGGHPQARTPHMDRLAGKGVLFRNAHSNVAVCSPSRASFMHGILPTTSGCWGFDPWLKNEVLAGCKTLPEYARDNGYRAFQTGKVLHTPKPGVWNDMGAPSEYGPLAFNGLKAVTHPSCPDTLASLGALDSTFAPLSDVPVVPASDDAPGAVGWWNTKGKKNTRFHYASEEDRDRLTDEKSAAWVKAKLAALEAEQARTPFLIAMGLIRPHTPLVVPQQYYTLFPLDEIQLPKIKDDDTDDLPWGDNSRGRKAFEGLRAGYADPEEGLRRYIQAYLACVAFVDDQVGDVVSALEQSSFNDNTIVILFSDHGYNHGQKDYLFKYCLWEESTRVPLMIKDPRYAATAGSTVDHPVSLVDVFPTLQDLCGWSGSTLLTDKGVPLDGHSLRPFLEDPATTQWAGPEVALSVIASWKSRKPAEQNLSVRSREYRYSRYFPEGEELYDHRADPHEWNNLADDPEYAPVKERLNRQLNRLLVTASDTTAPQPDPQPPPEVTSDNEAWKAKYFGRNPDADMDGDGNLSWPEYHAHKKATNASK